MHEAVPTATKMSVREMFSKLYQCIVLELYLIWQFVKLYFIGVYSLMKQMYEGNFRPAGYPDQTGKVAIVTGGGSGIGRCITHTLVSYNCSVFIASRCGREADFTIKEILEEYPSAKVKFIPLDLSSLKSVRLFAETFLQENCPLHLLINNAGVMLTPYTCTEDGYEMQHQVNFLGHFYLTQVLLDKLRASGSPENPSCIVNVASSVHLVADPEPSIFPSPLDHRLLENCYSAHNAYAVSKLAIVMMTAKLASVLKGDNSPVTAKSVHPGVVDSGLYQHVHWTIQWLLNILAKFLYKTVQQGADTVIDVALSPENVAVSGQYFDNGVCVKPGRAAQDLALQEKVWQHTLMSLNLRPDLR